MATAENTWHYEVNGERKQVPQDCDIKTLIENGEVSYGTLVWKQGLQDWIAIEKTELNELLQSISPPPLTGSGVNNRIVWVLAAAPIIGYLLEAFVAGIVYGGSEWAIEKALRNSEFFYITILLNIGLSIFDAKKLEKSGTDTSKFKGMVWLVPVYLYQRSNALKQGKGYFWTWIGCFSLVLLSAL